MREVRRKLSLLLCTLAVLLFVAPVVAEAGVKINGVERSAAVDRSPGSGTDSGFVFTPPSTVTLYESFFTVGDSATSSGDKSRGKLEADNGTALIVNIASGNSVRLNGALKTATGALTIQGSGTLQIDSAGQTAAGIESTSGAITISGSVNVTVTAAEGQDAIKTGGSGAISITTGGTVKANADSAAWSLNGTSVTVNAGNFETAKGGGIKSSTGAIDIGGKVSYVDSIISTSGNITIAGTVTTADSTHIDAGTGDVSYTNSTVGRIRAIKGKKVSIYSGVRADTISGTSDVVINASTSVQSRYIKGEKVTSTAAVYVDSIVATGGDISLSGSVTKNAGGVGKIEATAGDISINGAVGDSIQIIASDTKNVTINDNARVNAFVTAGDTSIRAKDITINGRLYASGHVVAKGDITGGANSFISADTISAVETGKKISIAGRIDTVKALITSTGAITINGPVYANADTSTTITSTNGAITIKGSTSNTPIWVGQIKTGGAISIESANVVAKDSIYTTSSLTVKSSVNALNGLEGNANVSISGGAIKVKHGIRSNNAISVSGPATLAEVDTIISKNGDVTFTKVTGGKAVGLITGGNRVTIDEESSITISDSISATGTLTIAGTLTIGGHTGGADGDEAVELITVGELILPTTGTLRLLSGDTVDIVGRSVTLEGSISGQAGVVAARNGDLSITGISLKADSISASSRINVSGSGATVTLGASAASKPAIRASEITVTNSATVTTKGSGSTEDIAGNTVIVVNRRGTLARENGTGIKEGTGARLSNSTDGSANIILWNDYPRILDVTAEYVVAGVNISVTADSITTAGNNTRKEVWLNSLSNFEGFNYDFYHEETALLSRATTGPHDIMSTIVPINPTLLGTEGWISVVTSRGVARAQLSNVARAEILRNDKAVKQTPSTAWLEDNPTFSNNVGDNIVYSDETIKVTFYFGKAATKNETLIMGSTFNKQTLTGVDATPVENLFKSLFTYDTDILPAGESDVTVTFNFRNKVNEELLKKGNDGYPLGVPGTFSATVKNAAANPQDEDKSDYTFGVARSAVVRLYDVATPNASFVPPSVGSTGSVDLGFSGGTYGLFYRLPGKTDWHRWYATDEDWDPKYVISAADVEAIFADGAKIEYKDANTGGTILTILGPNAGGSTGGNTDPSVSHSIVLSTSPYLITTPGLYPSRDQTFAFDISLPEGTDADNTEVILTIISVVNGLESAPAEVRPKVTSNLDGTLKIHVSDIITDIKITAITLRAATGTEPIVSTSVWSSGSQLTITSPLSGIAKIYSLRGSLVSEFTYGEGSTSITLPVGLYVVTLSDGTTTKVLIK
jgi:hypothetical protein